MKLKSLIKKIEAKYPTNLAYDWDNVGLLVGDAEDWYALKLMKQ